MIFVLIYVIGVVYFLFPVEGYSFRENTTYAVLWPVVFFVLFVGLVILLIAGKYDEVKSQISR